MKKLLMIACSILLVLGFGFGVLAENHISEDIEGYRDAVIDAIPEEVLPFLEMEGQSIDHVSFEKLILVSEKLLKNAVKVFLKSLGSLLGMITFSAILGKINGAFSRGKNICELIPFLLLLVFLINEILVVSQQAGQFCKSIQSFMTVISVSLGGAISVGGNVISASSMVGSVTAISIILEKMCLSLLFPIINISLVSMIGTFSEKSGLESVGRISRSFFNWLIGIVSFVCVTVFTYQSIIAKTEDSVSASALRYAVNGSIPMVGGAVGESLRVITSSVNVIRSSIGSLGIMTMIVFFLLPLLMILSLKFSVFITEEISNTLSLEKEKRLLCETRKLLNMIIAVVVMMTMVYIFILSLYMLIPLAYLQ